MQLKYLHQETNPILPAVEDIRFIPTLEYKHDCQVERSKTPKCQIDVAKCVEVLEHHIVYEFLGKDFRKAIPYELADKFGYLSIDDCIRWILNSFMQDIIDRHSKNSSSMFSNNSEIQDYFSELKDLVLLSRQVLKEADKAKNLYTEETNQ